MVRAFCVFGDRKGALVEPLRLAILTLVSIQVREVGEGLAYVWVARTERCFADRQRALEEVFRLPILALRSIHVGQVVEALAHVGMALPKSLLPDHQGALVEFLRIAVLALRPENSPRLWRVCATSGWLGPRACSLMTNARLWSSSASPILALFSIHDG